jgi:hypothetical protein
VAGLNETLDKNRHKACSHAPGVHDHDKKGKMSYLGYRQPMHEIRPAKSVYETIRYMNLGQMSALNTIPDYYVRFLLGYVIQVSRAMAHAHRNGLVHGHFDLSRVLVQSYRLNSKEREALGGGQDSGRRSLLRRTSLNFLDPTRNYNFMVGNFEPYQVTRKLMQFVQPGRTVDTPAPREGSILAAMQELAKSPEDASAELRHHNKDKHYRRLLNVEGMKITREQMMQLMMMRDLQEFGHSIVEIMVGRCSEQQAAVMQVVKKEESATGALLNLARTEAAKGGSGAVGSPKSTQLSQMKNSPLDLIPMNWCKQPEAQYLFRIVAMTQSIRGGETFVPANQADTAAVFEQIGEIARLTYINTFSREDFMSGRYTAANTTMLSRSPTDRLAKRLHSSVLNNQAVIAFLNRDDVPETSQEAHLDKIEWMLT